MRNRTRLLGGLLGAALAISSLPTESAAIPAFARKYRISCTTCHAPFPRLKPFGDEFAGNGMIIPEDEKDRYYVTGGDELLWLNKDFPVAARVDLFAVWEEKAEVESDFQIPWGVKLLSGGAVAKGIGYYFYFYMSERGEVAGIEDAYLHFDNIFASGLDVMVGQFQTSDPLMKRELRLTYEDYRVYTTRIGGSLTNLTYDRGLMLTYTIAPTSTDLVGMVVNGNGKGEADENRKFDSDNSKNFGFRLLQALGDHVSVGGFVYYGEEKLRTISGPEGIIENKVTYYGPDLVLGVGNISLTAEYLRRTDTAPGSPTLDGSDVETDGVVAELTWGLQGDMGRNWLTLLYNWLESDVATKLIVPVEDRSDYASDYETATLSHTYLIRRNVRSVLEYTYDLERETSRVTLGVVAAF